MKFTLDELIKLHSFYSDMKSKVMPFNDKEREELYMDLSIRLDEIEDFIEKFYLERAIQDVD